MYVWVKNWAIQNYSPWLYFKLVIEEWTAIILYVFYILLYSSYIYTAQKHKTKPKIKKIKKYLHNNPIRNASGEWWAVIGNLRTL